MTSPVAPNGFQQMWLAVQLFAKETKGVVALEFAIVGLPFFMLIWGIMAIGYMMYASATLDYTTQKAVRQLVVGTVQNANLTADQFRTTYVCAALPPSIFDCSKVVVNLKQFIKTPNVYSSNNYYQFVKSDSSGLIVPPLDNTQTVFCAGVGNTYGVIEVLYPFPILFSLFATSPNIVNGQFVVMSSSAFRMEPFAGGTTAAGC